ncbi:hypothetical protein BDQ17DRAFT_485996 [Cyathus striatus]|nr:hypothetical protein BDQ17DRAFT_485996 [Cyathus striatus]
MYLKTFTVACSLLGLAIAQDVSLNQVKKTFDDANIPADLHITFNPKVLFEVTFPEENSPPIILHAGIQLPRNASSPIYSVIGPASNGPFVVAAVDPDAPTRQNPTLAQVIHFLGGNFTIIKSILASTRLSN